MRSASRTRTGGALGILLLVAAALAAQDDAERRAALVAKIKNAAAQAPLPGASRFQLYNNCEPVYYYASVSDGAEEIGLTSKRLSDLVELRLRTARLYSADDTLVVGGPPGTRSPWSPYLFVNVRAHKPSGYPAAFRFDVKYMKVFTIDIRGTRESSNATTWERGTVGYGGRDFILDRLSEYIDEFILEYLRVNEDACDPTPRAPER